jgi:hypothetical protein
MSSERRVASSNSAFARSVRKRSSSACLRCSSFASGVNHSMLRLAVLREAARTLARRSGCRPSHDSSWPEQEPRRLWFQLQVVKTANSAVPAATSTISRIPQAWSDFHKGWEEKWGLRRRWGIRVGWMALTARERGMGFGDVSGSVRGEFGYFRWAAGLGLPPIWLCAVGRVLENH